MPNGRIRFPCPARARATARQWGMSPAPSLPMKDKRVMLPCRTQALSMPQSFVARGARVMPQGTGRRPVSGKPVGRNPPGCRYGMVRRPSEVPAQPAVQGARSCPGHACPGMTPPAPEPPVRPALPLARCGPGAVGSLRRSSVFSLPLGDRERSLFLPQGAGMPIPMAAAGHDPGLSPVFLTRRPR